AATKTVTATTNPAGLTGVTITYDGLSTAPANAGSYAVVASLSNANYSASDVTGTLIIGKATATITLSNIAQTYDAAPKTVTATTTPAGLGGVTVTYNGLPTAPTNAGSYAVAVSLSNGNYQGSANGTLVISKATASITLDGLAHTYDATPKSATATTNPEGLSSVSITYNGSATAPTNAGSYAVAASLTNDNYQGSANGTLIISKATTATITLAGLTQTYS